MVSHKTIKVNDTTTIRFNFEDECVRIQITNENLITEYIRYHNEFNDSLAQFNLTSLQSKKVRYWFYKNYKRIFPNQEYVSRYGRKIITPDHH
jgi:hypothetical protein